MYTLTEAWLIDINFLICILWKSSKKNMNEMTGWNKSSALELEQQRNRNLARRYFCAQTTVSLFYSYSQLIVVFSFFHHTYFIDWW